MKYLVEFIPLYILLMLICIILLCLWVRKQKYKKRLKQKLKEIEEWEKSNKKKDFVFTLLPESFNRDRIVSIPKRYRGNTLKWKVNIKRFTKEERIREIKHMLDKELKKNGVN